MVPSVCAITGEPSCSCSSSLGQGIEVVVAARWGHCYRGVVRVGGALRVGWRDASWVADADGGAAAVRFLKRHVPYRHYQCQHDQSPKKWTTLEHDPGAPQRPNLGTVAGVDARRWCWYWSVCGDQCLCDFLIVHLGCVLIG